MERRLEMVEDQMKQIQSGADTNLNIDVQEKDIQTPPQTADSMQSARSYTSGTADRIRECPLFPTDAPVGGWLTAKCVFEFENLLVPNKP